VTQVIQLESHVRLSPDGHREAHGSNVVDARWFQGDAISVQFNIDRGGLMRLLATELGDANIHFSSFAVHGQSAWAVPVDVLPNNGPWNAPLGDVTPDGRRGIEHEPGFVGLNAVIQDHPLWADQTSESDTLNGVVSFLLPSTTLPNPHPIPFHRPMRLGVGVLMVAELANGFTMRYSYALFLPQFTFQIAAPDQENIPPVRQANDDALLRVRRVLGARAPSDRSPDSPMEARRPPPLRISSPSEMENHDGVPPTPRFSRNNFPHGALLPLFAPGGGPSTSRPLRNLFETVQSPRVGTQRFKPAQVPEYMAKEPCCICLNTVTDTPDGVDESEMTGGDRDIVCTRCSMSPHSRVQNGGESNSQVRGHVYHVKCLRRWINRSPHGPQTTSTCPMCRAKLARDALSPRL
jgi:hypothetical protein